MKKLIIPVIMLLVVACANRKSYKKAEDAQDAAREFIRASLDGDYDKAEFFLLADSTNQLLLDKWKKDYDQLDQSTREKYNDADILPINIQAINDSVTSYTFSNSFKKDTSTVRVLRIKGEWLVDFKEILNNKK